MNIVPNRAVLAANTVKIMLNTATAAISTSQDFIKSPPPSPTKTKELSPDQARSGKPESIHGQRYIFNGISANPMFEMEHKVSLPKLNEGEVLVRVKAATICMSDIHTVGGLRVEPTPSVLGHEACVEVVEHRRDESTFKLRAGDRATFSIADSCGECEFCMNDLSQKCAKLFKYGHANMSSGTGFNGCYASHIIIRKGTEMIKLPDSINDELASTINCALATMVNCAEQIPDRVVRSGKRALIQGDGMLGLYGCALLKEMGFKEIYCSGHHESNRDDLIRKFGAIPLRDEKNELKSEANRFDCVIEACGDSSVVPNGMVMLKPGGAYIFVGMVHPKTQLELTGEQVIRKCLTIIGIHNYQPRHLRKSVEFLEKTLYKYPYDELIAPKSFKLSRLREALGEAKRKDYPRVCVRP